jgi:hypothetical protein
VPVACPNCGEELPEGARFCGACGQTMAPAATSEVRCPLCRAELPAGAKFCGACGQPLDGTDSLLSTSRMSLPDGMVRVQLIHGPTPGLLVPSLAAPAVPPAFAASTGAVPAPPPPPAEPAAPPREPSTPPHEPSAPPVAGYTELGSLDVEVDQELEDADAHFQLVEVDALARRGKYIDAVNRLLSVHGLPPGDPRLTGRLARLGREMGQAVAARGRAGTLGPTALRSHLLRLLRLAPDRGLRENLRLEIAPAAAAQDVARVRELLADGHPTAAATLVERVLALGPRISEFRALVHDVVRAVVAKALAEQHAGDAALARRDGAAAEERYAAALELLERDRILQARVERAREVRSKPRRPTGQARPQRAG